MAVIEVDDIAVRIGRPISDADEAAQVDQWIADVEMLLGARLGDLDLLDQTLLAYVEREVVVEWMRHRSEEAEADQESKGSYFLRILDPWWSLLDAGDTGSGAFSARPYFEADSVAYAINAWEIG